MVGTGNTSRTQLELGTHGMVGTNPDDVYPEEWKTSLEEAKAKVPFTLLVPDHPAANSQIVTAVYVRPGGATVAMQFPSPGKADVRQEYIEVFLLPWGGGDPSSRFAEDIEQAPVEGKSMYSIEGITAEGTLPNSPDDGEGANAAYLRFAYEGVEVQISGGDSLPLLEEIAKTIID